jgi:hypothetical protein
MAAKNNNNGGMAGGSIESISGKTSRKSVMARGMAEKRVWQINQRSIEAKSGIEEKSMAAASGAGMAA